MELAGRDARRSSQPDDRSRRGLLAAVDAGAQLTPQVEAPADDGAVGGKRTGVQETAAYFRGVGHSRHGERRRHRASGNPDAELPVSVVAPASGAASGGDHTGVVASRRDCGNPAYSRHRLRSVLVRADIPGTQLPRVIGTPARKRSGGVERTGMRTSSADRNDIR